MRAVSDTSSLSALALIDRLESLAEQFEAVACPEAVWAELMRLQDAEAVARLNNAVSDGWLKVLGCRDQSTIAVLTRTLDLGEAEAITLVKESFPDGILIIDELAGRGVARSLGIRVVGTLGILLRAKRAGTIESMRSELERLASEAGFYMSRSIKEEILRAAGEL